ncbi:hypothetical protein [Aurantiacibacter gilvus]|uniref:Uncharacterized protein n=1 Tax=Aurantiacibacter gilvus TaxID=3139141 RepID=A0ABU9IFM7_9SPHN
MADHTSTALRPSAALARKRRHAYAGGLVVVSAGALFVGGLAGTAQAQTATEIMPDGRAGTTVTRTSPAGAGDPSRFMDEADLEGGVPTLAHGTANPVFTFDSALSVDANSEIAVLFLSGSWAALANSSSGTGSGEGDAGSGLGGAGDVVGGIGGASGSGGDSANSGLAVGGVFTMTDIDNASLAGVASGAVLQSVGSVAVSADGDTTNYIVAPGSGSGGSVGVTGVAAMYLLDEAAHANVAPSASVSAPTVTLDATPGVNVRSLTGALAGGDSAGIGVSVAVNDLNTETQGDHRQQ